MPEVIELPEIDVEASSEVVGDDLADVTQRLERLPIAADPSHDIPVEKEIATLEVNGRLFTNWTSIRVECHVTQWTPIFQFECTEESPIPQRWDALQIVPGDIVRVYLGGAPVLFGYVAERHVAFDAKNHAVRIVGTGDTNDLTNSSVPPEKLNGHDGKSWTQLAADLAAHLNVKIYQRGRVDNTPFQNIQILPGETIAQALERYAKARAIVIGSRAEGGLLAIGEHSAIPTGELIEGYNILQANVAVRDPMVYRREYVLGQNTGSDNSYGDAQNKQIAVVDGTSTRNRMLVVPMEIADTMHGVQRRAIMEKIFTEGSFIEAQIKVQGWFKFQNQSEQLWRAGEYYTVNSPSLILPNKILGCSTCVYEQNAGGTTTTMTMVQPIHMWGQLNVAPETRIFAMQEANRKAAADAAKKKQEAGQ